jgi:hypothetical protein
MLLAIAFASTVTSDNSKPAKKESPLFGIRTRRAIREKVGDMVRRFIGERVFFIPFQWFKNRDNLAPIHHFLKKTDATCPTCPYTVCTCDCSP